MTRDQVFEEQMGKVLYGPEWDKQRRRAYYRRTHRSVAEVLVAVLVAFLLVYVIVIPLAVFWFLITFVAGR